MSSTEIAKIMNSIRANTRRMIEAADGAAAQVAEDVAQDASSRAPVDSGDLRDDLLGVERLPKDRYDRYIFDIGSSLPYAAKVEYEDTPMLRPALNEHEPDLYQRVAAAVRAAIR